MNNAHYADFACDSLHLERLGRGKFVRSFQIGYVSECQAGETLWVDTAVQDGQLFGARAGTERNALIFAWHWTSFQKATNNPLSPGRFNAFVTNERELL